MGTVIAAQNSYNTSLPASTIAIPQSTENVYTSAIVNPICVSDLSPNPDNTCLDFYRWNSCEEDWMKGQCCGTCGYASCLDICYENDINNIPQKYYPNPFDCDSNYPPPPGADGSQPTCQEQASWNNCGEWWIYGFCCSSCPEDCGCTESNISITNEPIPIPIVTVFYNHTNSKNNCVKDISPPPGPDGKIPSCIDQYRWGNCGESWMLEYCCLTCGYASCLDSCYDGSVDNIPEKYYPNPLDCELNEAINEHSCVDQASWNNCGQTWMYGFCCISCPEACGCTNYSWGNNTEYIHLRPQVIVTLTYEEILFWEKFFIALHTVLLFSILIIPMCICYKYWFQNLTSTLLHKIATMTTETSTAPEQVTNTNTSVSPAVSSDESSVAISSQSNSRSKKAWSRSRTTSTNYETANKNHVLHFYKLLAIICILLWSLVVIFHIVTLVLWHHDEETMHVIDNISKPWDIFRMLIYILAKMLMYISFIARIYFSFNTSAYSYSIHFIAILISILIIDTIVKMVCYTTQIIDLSGNIIDRTDNHTGWLFYALVFLIIEETLYTIVLIAAFIRPLFILTSKSDNGAFISMMIKYLILGIWCILSSAIVSIIRLFYISTTDLFIIWFTAFFESFDCSINTFCTILLFKFTYPWYKCICKSCIKCVELLCVQNYKQKHIELCDIK